MLKHHTRSTRTMIIPPTMELEPDTCECCRDNDNAPYYGYKGYVFSKLMPKVALGDLQKWEARKNDVFLVGYPGSGVDCLREIVWQTIANYSTEYLQRRTNIATECTHLNIRQLFNDHNSSPSIDSTTHRLITTHLPASLFPPSIFTNQCKVIYIARHPKDAAVEYFQITNQDVLLPRYRTWRRFYTDFRRGHVYGGSWFDHTLHWWARRHEKNVLFVKYEEIFADVDSLLSKLYSFLGCTSKTTTQEDTCGCSQHDRASVLAGKNGCKYTSALFSEGYAIYDVDWRDVFKVSHNDDFDSLYRSKMADCDLELSSDSELVRS